MKLLFVIPSLSLAGGVASHYAGLAPYWTVGISYSTYGKRKKIPAPLTLLPDIISYTFKIVFKKIDVVVVNPSLRKYQLFRDGIYILIALLFKKKVVTFIHGWDVSLSAKLEKRNFLFNRIYGKSAFIYVLSSAFKTSLTRMGIQCPILQTTTKVNDSFLDQPTPKTETHVQHILFLSRIIKTKGIYIAIDAFHLLKQEFKDLKLLVCGDGAELGAAQRYVKERSISDVTFTGRVAGKDLIKSYQQSDIYILPSYEEGLATSVLEAMGFGLPVITRPVGGIIDFFVNGKMGQLVDSLSPEDFAQAIKPYIAQPQICREVGTYNRTYADSHFRASRVAEHFEQDIKKYCQ